MDAPNTNWPEVILEEDAITKLEANFEDIESSVVKRTQLLTENPEEFETSESIAIELGFWMFQHFKESFQPICEEHIDGEEGKELMRGFLGAQAMECAN